MLKKLKLIWFYEDLQHFLEITPKKCPFHHRGLECKSRKSRDTWINIKIWPWSTKWSRAKANRVLPRDHTVHSKNPLPKTWDDSTHGHHQIFKTEIILIMFFAAKDGEALNSQQKQVWELTVAQIMNSLLTNSDLNWKTQGKPLGHSNYLNDLNQITYDYTVEMTNRFKRLNLRECLKNYGWKFITLYRRQWTKPSQRKRHNGCLKRPYK